MSMALQFLKQAATPNATLDRILAHVVRSTLRGRPGRSCKRQTLRSSKKWTNCKQAATAPEH